MPRVPTNNLPAYLKALPEGELQRRIFSRCDGCPRIGQRLLFSLGRAAQRLLYLCQPLPNFRYTAIIVSAQISYYLGTVFLTTISHQ